MRKTTIPGISARHSIITPECRKNWGIEGAFYKAHKRAFDEYLRCVENGFNDEVNFHLVLTIERKEPKPEDKTIITSQDMKPGWDKKTEDEAKEFLGGTAEHSEEELG